MDIKKVITLVILGVLSLNRSAFAYDPLFKAINNADVDQIKEVLLNVWLLDDNDLTLEQVLNERDAIGETPLIKAIREYNTANNLGYFDRANKFYNIITVLVESGADVNLDSPLFVSVVNNDKKTFQFLLDNGASIDAVNNNTTLIMEAVRIDIIQPEWLDLILENKPNNIDFQNNVGFTALMTAVLINDAEKVKILKCAGSNLTIKDNNGNTALDLANQINNGITNALNNARLLNDISETKRLENELKINKNILRILMTKSEKCEA